MINDVRTLHILCVDDSPIFRSLLFFIFAEWPHVIILQSPLAALRLAQERAESQSPIVLFITDIEMPEMNGIKYAKKLRQIPRYAKTPIIFLTSEACPAVKEQALSITPYLMEKCRKSTNELETTIRHLIKNALPYMAQNKIAPHR